MSHAPARFHDDLEALYAGPLARTSLSGCFDGSFLGFLPTPAAQHTGVRLVDALLFVVPRFGVDFGRNVWWFVSPGLSAGRFRLTAGRSRWRDTDALRLTYEASRLPVRGLLYDEIKPLPDGRVLGIGGVNAERGRGEHFFFELSPR